MSSYLAQPDMDIGMTGHHFSQQQAPPNQTAPWPDSMMPIDPTFANQNRLALTCKLTLHSVSIVKRNPDRDKALKDGWMDSNVKLIFTIQRQSHTKNDMRTVDNKGKKTHLQ